MLIKDRRHTEFFSLLTLLILTRVADGILTYKITPDLSLFTHSVTLCQEHLYYGEYG
jgi:hypothetical protein